MRIFLNVSSKHLLAGLFFFLYLSIQNWTAAASDFSFSLPERIKPKRISSSTPALREGVDMLERAMEVARPEMLKPYEPILHLPGNSKDDWLSNGYCRISTHSDIRNRDLHSHIFAVATHTFQMWGIDGATGAEAWAPLPLHVLQGDKSATAYQVDARGKRICFFGAVETGESDFEYDVVAHEAGHAVLDHLRPDFRGSSDPFVHFQLRTLHEAFGDVTAIFSSLSLAAHSGFAPEINSLFASKLPSAIAPHYGENDYGLRNHSLILLDKYKDFIKDGNYHSFSQIVTGLTYGIIFDLCTHELAPVGGGSKVDTDFTRKIRNAFLKSFLEAPIHKNIISDLATILGTNLKEFYHTPSEERVRDRIEERVRDFQTSLDRILIAQ